jgi:lambda repressor-like predicted transcriptional regulator
MRQLRPDRKRQFKAALALRGMTARQWAENEGITRQHLNNTLNDETVSRPLTEKIKAFIAEVGSKVLAA